MSLFTFFLGGLNLHGGLTINQNNGTIYIFGNHRSLYKMTFDGMTHILYNH